MQPKFANKGLLAIMGTGSALQPWHADGSTQPCADDVRLQNAKYEFYKLSCKSASEHAAAATDGRANFKLIRLFVPAALGAGLGLAVAGIHTGSAERSRTDALARRVRVGTVCKASICCSIGNTQFGSCAARSHGSNQAEDKCRADHPVHRKAPEFYHH